MADIDLAALRAKAEAASPGEWVKGKSLYRSVFVFRARECGTIADFKWPSDAEFCAAASPSVVLALLDRVEKGEDEARRIYRVKLSDDRAFAEEVSRLHALLARAGEALRPFITEWVPGQDPVKADLKVGWGHVERAHALAAEIEEAIGHGS